MKFDTKRDGRLDKRTFLNALNQLPMQVSDADLLFQAGESLEYRGMVDIQLFIDRVLQASKYSPLASAVQQQKQTKKGGGNGGGPSQS
jgi:chromosome segregation ATPase